MLMLQCDIFYTTFGNNEIPDVDVLIKKNAMFFQEDQLHNLVKILRNFWNHILVLYAWHGWKFFKVHDFFQLHERF